MRVRLRRILLAVVGFLAIGSIALYFSIGPIVRRLVRSQISGALNLRTEITSAGLGGGPGDIRIGPSSLASPAGFAAEPFLTVESARLMMSSSQYGRNPAHIWRVEMDRPRLLVEQVHGKFNITAVVDGMPPRAAKPLKLIVDQIVVTRPTVVIRPIPALGIDRAIEIEVESFTLNNVGLGVEGEDQGARVGEIVMRLITTLAAQASNSPQAPDNVRQLLRGDVRAIVAAALPGGAGKMISRLLPPAVLSPTTLFASGRRVHPTTQPATTRPAGGFPFPGSLGTVSPLPRPAVPEPMP